jgi:ATP-dependent DNA helicase RecG
MSLSAPALRRYITGGETNTVELKVAVPRPAELAERMCGMANARGGLIIIGIEDGSLAVIGVPAHRMALTRDMILRAARMIDPPLVLDPPEPEVYELDSKQVVVATIPPSKGPVYQASGVFWMRRGTHTVPLRYPEMLELAHDRGLQDWELQPATQLTMQDIDRDRVEAYLRQRSARGIRSGRFPDMQQVLLGMNCAKILPNGRVVPTYAGLLFFGYEPQLYLVQSEVVCVLYRDALGIGGYADRKVITGPIQKLIDETEGFLNQHVPVGARIEGWRRVDLPEYPLEALREAVVNAVVHRDYSRRGESIRVFYYADRIEIHSPGLLLPGITVEQMQQGDVTSRLRNPIIAGLLRDIPGYMERIGSGVRLMLHETEAMGLPPPQFQERDEFIVTFRKVPDQEKTPPLVASPVGTLWEHEPQSTEDLPERASEPLLEQERRVKQAMQYLQTHGTITNGIYRQLTDVSEATARRDLEELVGKGVLRASGKTRGRQYRLP